MRRPPSYSDSFLLIPSYRQINYEEEGVVPEKTEEESWSCTTCIFMFKGSFHIFCISVFETTFYFLYVNHSEDAGIFNTINTYYSPVVAGCATRWTNTTRWLVQELLLGPINQTQIDRDSAVAYQNRNTYNTRLIFTSAMYSVACFLLCLGIVGITICMKWKVKWAQILLENILFILLLAAYEFFFYNTIIYHYITLSTAELNKYIVDGLASCA